MKILSVATTNPKIQKLYRTNTHEKRRYVYEIGLAGPVFLLQILGDRDPLCAGNVGLADSQYVLLQQIIAGSGGGWGASWQDGHFI
jgi:hypothetical protein